MGTTRLEHRLAEVARCAHRHAPEADVDGWLACVEERVQSGRKRAVVGQDPCSGLDDVEIRQVLPWRQERIRGQPGSTREDVVTDVIERRQAELRAPLVQGLEVQRVHPLRVLSPEHPVVSLVLRRLLAGAGSWCEMPRWQPEDVERREHIADAELLGDRSRPRRHEARRQDHVASFGCRGQRLEPGGDELRRQPERRIRSGCLQPCGDRPCRRTERRDRHPDSAEERPELLVGWRADPYFRPEFSQPQGEGGERLHVSSRAPRGEQDTHGAVAAALSHR